MTYDQQQFQDYFNLWQDELLDGQNYSPDWQQYRSTAASKLVRDKAHGYGSLPAVSLFIRAFNELRASGVIKPVRAPKPVEKDFTLTASEYERMPANEIIRRYRNQNEPEFKAAVDALIAKGLI